jgi:phage host-nuclease inhibitor protein Gam
MSDEFECPTTWLVVYGFDDGYTQIMVEDERPLREAVRRYCETGKDEVVSLTMLEGSDYFVRASCVRSWWIRTEEHTRRNVAMIVETRRRKAAINAEFGLAPDE